MSGMSPIEFMKKWDLSPSQFGAMMGLASAQSYRLTNKTSAKRGAPTQAQSDRIAELDLLLEMRSAGGCRDDVTVKISRLVEAVEILLKLISVTAPDELRGIVNSIAADKAMFEGSDAIQRLEGILDSDKKD